jgi:hypothetical protein
MENCEPDTYGDRNRRSLRHVRRPGRHSGHCRHRCVAAGTGPVLEGFVPDVTLYDRGQRVSVSRLELGHVRLDVTATGKTTSSSKPSTS